jgi:hypothetical protein
LLTPSSTLASNNQQVELQVEALDANSVSTSVYSNMCDPTNGGVVSGKYTTFPVASIISYFDGTDTGANQCGVSSNLLNFYTSSSVTTYLLAQLNAGNTTGTAYTTLRGFNRLFNTACSNVQSVLTANHFNGQSPTINVGDVVKFVFYFVYCNTTFEIDYFFEAAM